MTHQWDEFSKSLAEPLPRRESLRRLGVALAGAVLSPLGLQTASAGHHPKRQPDPCKAFCKCRNKKQQNQCLAACNTCNGATNRLCGGCGSYVCCAEPGPNEYGACVSGRCEYWCAEGAVVCDGVCSLVGWDPFNCGGCGNVCPAAAPYCQWGTCAACPEGRVLCNGVCSDLAFDPSNCGACGNVCGGPNPSCYQGACSQCTPYCPERWCGGDGCGGVCACPSGTYCESDGWCYDNCSPGLTWCDPVCVDLSSDSYNCGACGNVCPDGFVCSSGGCWDPVCQFVEC